MRMYAGQCACVCVRLYACVCHIDGADCQGRLPVCLVPKAMCCVARKCSLITCRWTDGPAVAVEFVTLQSLSPGDDTCQADSHLSVVYTVYIKASVCRVTYFVAESTEKLLFQPPSQPSTSQCFAVYSNWILKIKSPIWTIF